MSYVKNAVRTVRVLSPAEQKKILGVTGEHREGFRDHVIISLVLGTGLREMEVAALSVGDVAKGREVRGKVELRVFAHKGTSKRKDAKPLMQAVFLPKIVRRKLLKFLAWKKREGEPVDAAAPLFCAGVSSTAAGDHPQISTRALRRMFRVWQVRAGFDGTLFTFHELRHTALTTLYRRTKDVMLVQRAARHKSVTTTMIYTHTSDDELRSALEDQPS